MLTITIARVSIFILVQTESGQNRNEKEARLTLVWIEYGQNRDEKEPDWKMGI